MMTPLAPPAGTSTSAVTENDLFLMTTTLFSVSRPIPPKSSCELPRTSCGRPARSALKRSNRRSSSGSTPYLAASIRKSRCSSASFSGISFARSRAWVQSVRAVVQLPDVVVEAAAVPPSTHGVECLVTADQPWW